MSRWRFCTANTPFTLPPVAPFTNCAGVQGDILCVTPQNGIEFWNAATRPAARNGYGKTPEETRRLLRVVHRLFPLLPDDPQIYPEWQRIVVQFGVSGVQVHDARLVAVMRVYGVSHILTFNNSDFARYAPLGIVAVNPNSV